MKKEWKREREEKRETAAISADFFLSFLSLLAPLHTLARRPSQPSPPAVPAVIRKDVPLRDKKGKLTEKRPINNSTPTVFVQKLENICTFYFSVFCEEEKGVNKAVDSAVHVAAIQRYEYSVVCVCMWGGGQRGVDC
jgi:hypothetical protein